MREIEHLLRDRIGLDATSVGPTLIQRAVRLRMKNLGLRTLEDYRRMLLGSAPEWQELVESVIVTETWFFRDREAFTVLASLVAQGWLNGSAAGPARLLSVPCSSGEEPYSMAIALLDAGVPADRFCIEAVDISARALARARAAVYGKNSFRGTDLDFGSGYFQPTRSGLALHPAIRRCVHFSQGNLLSEDFQSGKAAYDFIFCRNLLVYFDSFARRRALGAIHRLLAPSGLLLVGPAEQPLVTDHGFVSANIPTAFVSQRAVASAARLARPVHSHGQPGSAARTPSTVPAVPKPPQPQWKVALQGIDATNPDAHPDLKEARRLADAGRLEEATAICESHLRDHRTSAHAYYLLGLTRDARGDATAIDCYRKALYLEPHHKETLLQMALLAEKNRDSLQARTFRRRAQRVKAMV